MLESEPEYRFKFGNISNSITRRRLSDWFRWRPLRWWKFDVLLGREPIGVAAIEQDRRNAVCFIVLGLLPEHRGKKIGCVTARLLMRKCFETFQARRVETTALGTNQASLNMQDGMIHEGTLKGRFLIDGVHVDELLFRMLDSEWWGA